MRGKGASQKRVFRSQALKLLSDLGEGRGAEQGFKRGLGVNRICLDEAEQEVMAASCRVRAMAQGSTDRNQGSRSSTKRPRKASKA